MRISDWSSDVCSSDLSYHIVGLYELKHDDILFPKAFPDTIAKGAHVIDIHASDSNDQDGLVIPRQEYNVPFRCLVPRGSVNLVPAGRCLSEDGPGSGRSEERRGGKAGVGT